MPQPIHLNTFSFLYDEGYCRKLRLQNGSELIRAVYPAVRDRNWRTVPFTVTEEKITEEADCITIRLQLYFRQNEISFSARLTIKASGSGHFDFTYDGQAETSFLKNRIGLNVLLPIEELTGCECNVINLSGEVSSGRFPVDISPHQPLKDIRQMNWWDKSGNDIRLIFDGDTFEMEDQRNWTDASYKIYSTPLSLPFPVQIEKGEKVWQRVNMKIVPQRQNKTMTRVTVPACRSTPSHSYKLPEIGLGASGEKELLTEQEIIVLRELGIDYGSFLCDLEDVDWYHKIQNHFGNCQKMKIKAKPGIIVPSSFFMQNTLLDLLTERSEEIASVEFYRKNSFISEGETITELYKSLKSRAGKIWTGGGTYAHFTELNRSKLPTGSMEYITFSVTPQVHGFDNLTLIENLKGLSYVASDAQQKYSLPVDINALTLKQRMNFVATGKDVPTENSSKLPETFDTRQPTVFNALWTLGAITNLMFSGIKSVSLFETVGRCGVIQSQEPLPGFGAFPGKPLVKYPVYHVLKELLRHKSASFLPVNLSDNEFMDGFEIKAGRDREIWVWSYDEEPHSITIDSFKPLLEINRFNFDTGKWEKYEESGLQGEKEFSLNHSLIRIS